MFYRDDAPTRPRSREAYVAPEAEVFSHDEARAVARQALGALGPADRDDAGVTDADVVVVDLSRAGDATTAAFAALVLLRRALLRAGRDLRLTGLRGRARQVYAVNRLGTVLPDDAALASADDTLHLPPQAGVDDEDDRLRAAA